jgi:sugar phosphate permease
MKKSPTPALYRGWSVVAGGFFCAMLAVGGSIYIFGLFALPLSAEFGLSRADFNNGLIIKLVGTAMWSPFIGRLLDRVSVPRVISVGALLYALGLVIISMTSSLLIMGLAIFIPVSMGVTCAGPIAVNTVATRWFRRRRGRAIGILAVATSAGGAIMTPIVAVLIDAFGWRMALGITGLGVGVGIFLAASFLVRNQPKLNDIQGFDEFDMQVVPATSGSAQGVLSGDLEPDGMQWKFRHLSKNRNFWFIGVGCGLLLASDQAILVSQVPYLQDSGVSLTAAAFFASCLTLSAVGGKLLVGFLSDRFDIRRLLGVIVLCHCALLVALIIQPNYWVLVGVASTFGVAVGGVFPVWLGLTARVFGAKSYGTIMGVMALVMQPISVVAIRFIGESRDRTGSYDLGFGILILVVILAYFVVAMIRFPNTERN